MNKRGFELDKLILSEKSFNLTNAAMSHSLLGKEFQETFKIFEFATVYGIEYRPQCNLLIDLDDLDYYPIFAKICNIFSNNVDVLFLVELYETISYSKHFGSYIVKPTQKKQIVDLSQLQWKDPLFDVNIDGCKYISLRYAL